MDGSIHLVPKSHRDAVASLVIKLIVVEVMVHIKFDNL